MKGEREGKEGGEVVIRPTQAPAVGALLLFVRRVFARSSIFASAPAARFLGTRGVVAVVARARGVWRDPRDAT